MATIVEPKIAEFLSFLRDGNKSENTIEAYQRGLNYFHGFLRTINLGGVPVSWRRVNQVVIKDFLIYLDTRRPKGKPISPSTKSQRFSAVRAFFQFLVTKGHVQSNPTEGIALPRVTINPPKLLDEQQIEDLLEQPAKLNTPQALRDQAMMKLLYATGLRNTELVSLNLKDILSDKRGSRIRCIGKDNKERTLPIEGMALNTLVSYIETVRPKLVRRNKSKTALFINHRGERITRQGFWLILKNRAKDAKIDSLVTPDILRHCFAVHQINQGVPVEEVKDLMGHTTISTTLDYLDLADASMREVYNAAHPRSVKARVS